ncbi:hypothetical protein ACIP98_19060 [Streptomyces sp. NPDC088354]|uniref:hypothetical protein n=1 Tax=Streptomyces sp. NPDC088354 TaxID=3365856 RepID=UPI003805CAB4
MAIAGRLRAAERAYPGRPVHLVPPARAYPDRRPGPFGSAAVVPAVACIGAFDSAVVARDPDSVLDGSALIVVWFLPARTFRRTTPRIPWSAPSPGRHWPEGWP